MAERVYKTGEVVQVGDKVTGGMTSLVYGTQVSGIVVSVNDHIHPETGQPPAVQDKVALYIDFAGYGVTWDYADMLSKVK